MNTKVPTVEEKHWAEEAVLVEAVEAQDEVVPEFYDEETVATMTRSMTRSPEAMTAFALGLKASPDAMNIVVAALFTNDEFKKYLAMSFASIYDSFTKMTNNAIADFTTQYEVRLLEATTGSPYEFHITLVSETELEFFTIDETGERHVYPETNPGVLKSAFESLATINATPDATKNYIAVLAPREVDISIQGADGVVVSGADILKSAAEKETSVH